jgi:hypothetical protein
MIARALAALLACSAVAACSGHARAQGAQRFEGTLFSFSYPSAAATAPGTDPSADVAVSVTLAGGAIAASVIGATKKVSDGDVENEASAWHAARVKNRAAWGMKAGGGPPRDSVRIGERRWLRWRDRIGSVLGAQEQTMTCGGVSAHLVCVVVSAPQKERERGDALAAQILSSLAVHKR